MFRHLLTIAVWLLLICRVHAQNAQDGIVLTSRDTAVISYDTVMKRALAPLDLSSITSGIFMDKAFPYIRFDRFTGSTPGNPESRTDSLQTFYFLHGMVCEGALASGFGPMSNLDELLSGPMTEAKNTGIVPLVLMDYSVHRFRANALSDNLIRVDSSDGYRFYDVLPRTSSPFEESRVVAAVPLLAEIPGLTATFQLDPRLFFRNPSRYSESLPDVYIGVDGREPIKRSWNVPFQLSFYAEIVGYHNLHFQLKYPDGRVYSVLSRIKVTTPQQTAIPYTKYPDAEQRFSSSTNSHGGGSAQIFYACGRRELVRPLIVVKGYEPNAARDIFGLGINGHRFMASFKEQDDYSFADINLAEYDIVYVEYNNGGDYIQRNAMLVREIIQWVNANKKSTEPLTVWGISMGGLVARMALAGMEKEGLDHQTRLFLAYDSPFQGAVVPPGIQALVNQVFSTDIARLARWLDGDNKRLYTLANEYLNSPAAKQMLVFHINGNGEHARLMADLAALGYPTRCRNVAVTNGATNNTGQGFSYRHEIIRLETSNRGYLDEVIRRNVPGGWGGSVANLAKFMLMFDLRGQAIVNALPSPSQGTQRISGIRLDLGVCIRIWFIRIQFWIPLTRKDQHASNSSGTDYEFAPGSRAPDIDKIASFIPNLKWAFVPTVSSLDIRRTGSSWFYHVDNGNIINNGLTPFKAYAKTGWNPNDAHTWINYSSGTFLTSEIARYSGTTPEPTLYTSFNYGQSGTIATLQIIPSVRVSAGITLSVNKSLKVGHQTGSNPVSSIPSFRLNTPACSNTTITVDNGGTLEVGDPSGAKTATLWIRTGSQLVLNGNLKINPGSKLVVECGAKLVLNSGYKVEKAGTADFLLDWGSIENKSGSPLSFSFTPFSIGVPGNITGPSCVDVCYFSANSDFTIPLVPGAYNYEWFFDHPNVQINSGQGTNSINVSFRAPIGYFNVYVRTSNACTWVNSPVFTFGITKNGLYELPHPIEPCYYTPEACKLVNGDDWYLTAYPNPTSDRLNLKDVDFDGQQEFNYRIVDQKSGKSCLQGRVSRYSPSIDVSMLPAGLYYLEAVSGKMRRSAPILIY